MSPAARRRPDAVLLVSHGSRDARAQETTRAIEVALRRRLESDRGPLPVTTAYLDFAEPTVGEALRALAGEGAEVVRIVPLLFTPGYHLHHDVPGAVKRSGVAPAVQVTTAPCLLGVPGAGRQLLLAALTEQLAAAVASSRMPVALASGAGRSLAPVDDGGPTGIDGVDSLVLAAAGSSSRAARASVEYLTRELGRRHGIPAVAAFASAAQPNARQALEQLRAEGVEQPAVASLFVAPGRLPDAVRRLAGEVPVAEPLGTAPALVEVLALQAGQGSWQDEPHDRADGIRSG